MDEQFRRNKLWIGVAAVVILFMCVALCGLGAMASIGARSSTVYLLPPTSEEGAAPPPIYNAGPASSGLGSRAYTGPFSFIFGAVGFLFKVAFLGLILLLLLGLVRRLFWGPRHGWAHVGPRPPCGPESSHRSHPWHGPWAWHAHGQPWKTEDEPEDVGSDPSETDYSGPQE